MTQNMPKNMQIAVIKRQIHQKGIDPDLIDLEAYVDGRLTLQENLHDIMQNINFMVGAIDKNKHAPSTDVAKYQRYEQAEIIQSLRSARARRRDNQMIAHKRFDLKDLTEKHFEEWKNDPAHYDINGIDNNLKGV